jgi:hypothetical protein
MAVATKSKMTSIRDSLKDNIKFLRQGLNAYTVESPEEDLEQVMESLTEVYVTLSLAQIIQRLKFRINGSDHQ